MSDEFSTREAIGGAVGAAVAGVPGATVGRAVGGVLDQAYAAKPVVGDFTTTLGNDLAAENVTLDAHQIFVRITTGHGTASLAEANTAAATLSAGFAERANQIAMARGAAAAAWEGEASAAAASATTPLADSFAVARQQLSANAQALDAEITAFEHIRSQVEPVPATPPRSNLANDVNPFQTDTDAAINDYNAKAAKNIQLYEAYVAETTAARAQVPRDYAKPPALDASAAAITSTASPIGNASVPPPPVGAGGGGQPPAATGASATGGGAEAPPAPGGGAGGGSGSGSGAGGGGADGAGRQTPSLTTPSATTPGGVPLVPPARDGFTSVPVAGRPPRTTEAQRGVTGGGAGGVGGFGGGVGAGVGPAPRGGQTVLPGPTVGPAPPAGRGTAGVGVPAARGAAGPAGMPLGGAPGRGTGDEDQEHRRKYRVEPDDKELFGLDESYVTPVIGDRR